MILENENIDQPLNPQLNIGAVSGSVYLLYVPDNQKNWFRENYTSL